MGLGKKLAGKSKIFFPERAESKEKFSCINTEMNLLYNHTCCNMYSIFNIAELNNSLFLISINILDPKQQLEDLKCYITNF